MVKNNYKHEIIKYLVMSAIVLILSFAGINELYPFAIGAYVAAVFAGCSSFVLAPALVLGAFLRDFDWINAASVAVGAGVLIIAECLLSRKQKNFSVPLMIVMSLIAIVGESVISYFRGTGIVYIVVNVFLYMIFTYVCYGIFKPLLYYKMKHKLLDTETACLYIVVVALSMGVTALNVTGNIPLFLLAGVALPLCCKFVGKGAGVMTALAMGLGNAFYSLDVTTIALFGFVALACCMFISSPKILSPLAQVFAAVIFELFFEVDYLSLGYHSAALMAGGIIYAVIPEKAIDTVREKFFSSHSGAAIRHIINRNRYELARNAAYVGDVFEEMSAILGGMEKTGDSSIETIAKEVTKSCCLTCERYADCMAEGLEQSMRHVAAKTFEKGRASMSDLPFLLVDKCLYIGKIMSLCSSKVAALGMSAESIENDNMVTRMLAEQLSGVGQILRGMSGNIARPVSYDDKTERRIIEELRYYNIICSEALLCLGEKPSATLIIRNECVSDRKLIAEIAGKTAGEKFIVRNVDDSVISGWSVVELENCPIMDVTFGVASRPLKADAIGDTHSFMKIGGDKFLMAICDGMGSGKRAYDLSNKAMSLVEGFYKAGFGHDITTSGINRFLNIEEGESFSALDIAVCDLSACKADLVKLAAPASYVKKKNSVIRIDSSSLPLGVVKEAQPYVTTLDIEDGDAIIIASDGVTQRFGGDELSAIINNSSAVNPQLLADEILSKAMPKRGAPEDDMTVAVCHIFKRL